MTDKGAFFTNIAIWQQQANQCLIQGDYSQAASLYEQAIEAEPDVKSHYWHLGLLLLLQGQETEAQMIWLLPMAEGEPEQVELWTRELVEILQQEAVRREAVADDKVAWAIRQHIREISPDNLDNLLHIILLSVRLELFADDDSTLSQAVQQLKTDKSGKVDASLLLQVLAQILEHHPLHPQAVDLAEYCVSSLNRSEDYYQILNSILFEQVESFVKYLPAKVAAKYLELCLRLQPNNISILANLANLYQNTGRYLESLEFARHILRCSQALEDKIAGNYLQIRGLTRAGGYWQEASKIYQKLQDQLHKLVESNSIVSENHLLSLITTVAFSNYLTDEPEKTHKLRNKVAKFCQSSIQNYYQPRASQFQSLQLSKRRDSSLKPLKLGYISSCLRRHSVGWLVRWIFHYHNRDLYEIYAYSLKRTNDSLQQSFAENSSQFCDLSETKTVSEIAERINHDEIDLLIDLDSVTSSGVCGVMALKPAPIQVTWLGSDASGLPTIDYFIADPYVLPESAGNYYSAKIWRLPKTYIAVDGFEVGVPTLRRDQLNIPSDAVVYLSAQTGYKRHPHTARLQMQILKQVPNSYFLIKGLADEESIKRFFTQIAEEAGVDSERLRFLPGVELESVHRANLGIADVVLDTYPYNGATTTLETLWMCIPIVTRVGQQFAARNSYTMIMNAGVTEGISWTDEEYIEWGVRLGKDETLRQNVAWKLRQSRQTAPLWNAKQFTREMENAYKQMWQKYIEANQ
ncbi:MAG: O-linked N-acetylglucosamine transferase, SPINDLY family protein [Coleofasciculus sp. G1-WW12-02]|uniref:O-linked N-acetylglucosamine transferase, SPINDLY family protein n=1 Tax=Coleofasciculus sp. G1-WW12-02 TaxID=3068483 RepID=UPI0033009E1B